MNDRTSGETFVVCEQCRLKVELCKCEQPPPLAVGQEVWVRAVVEGVQCGVVHAAIHDRPVYMVGGGVVVSVPISALRRGEE